jgi:hypothetical protein
VGYGSFVPKKFSHEKSLKKAERAEAKGVQIEYKKRVDKILVRTAGSTACAPPRRGDIQRLCDLLCYPNKVYTSMIEPLSEVPEAPSRPSTAGR